MTPHRESPFHAGEQAVQARLGVRERVEDSGRRVVRGAMPQQHREFFAELPFIMLGAADPLGQPAATLLAGPPGFVRSPDDTTLRIDALPPADDPVAAGLRPEAALGVLGIELPTRRRNRANGTIAALDDGGLTLHVQQSFGNCPKYIQAREPVAGRRPSPGAPRRAHRVEADAARLIERADTFFIATHAMGASASAGADVSHRGGAAGFVRLADDGRTLTWPDFTGNFLFNTIGNLVLDPRAGLVLPDFERGDLLHIAGRVEIIWDGPQVDAVAGAQRLLRLHVDEAVLRPGALPQRWSLLA